MCEPLRGKELQIGSDKYEMWIDETDNLISKNNYKWFNNKKIYLKENVKSAVEFYKRYKNKPIRFMEDFENDFDIFCKDILKLEGESLIYKNEKYIEEDCLDEWNDWLFDYCFGDVIE